MEYEPTISTSNSDGLKWKQIIDHQGWLRKSAENKEKFRKNNYQIAGRLYYTQKYYRLCQAQLSGDSLCDF